MEIQRQLRRIDRAAREMNAALSELKKLHPGKQVSLYLDGTENLNVQVEPQGRWTPAHEDTIHVARLNASGGDW